MKFFANTNRKNDKLQKLATKLSIFWVNRWTNESTTYILKGKKKNTPKLLNSNVFIRTTYKNSSELSQSQRRQKLHIGNAYSIFKMQTHKSWPVYIEIPGMKHYKKLILFQNFKIPNLIHSIDTMPARFTIRKIIVN